MRKPLWSIVEWRLRRVLPPATAPAALGDLQEDYARHRAAAGALPSALWLIREARSLEHAYRRSRSPSLQLPKSPNLQISKSPNLSSLVTDLRHSWRRLVTRPAGALLSIALLALGIGLATAMFSVVDSVLFRPAPFPNPEQLVEVGFWDTEPDVMEAWRATGMFQSVEAARQVLYRVSEGGSGTWAGAAVTPGVFEMLGARPLYGRAFTATDTGPGGDAVLISEQIWRSTFGGDVSVLGRRITLNGASVPVIGIMPAAFRFPAPTTGVWRVFDPYRNPAAGGPGTRVIGRLAPGVPWTDVEKRTAAISRELARLPANYGGSPPLQRVGRPDRLDGFTRRALWLLLGGVGLTFLVLCANVSSLLLANLTGRRRELGVCSALGASRGRLIRQTAVEHAMLAGAGAGAGVALAWVLTATVPALFVDRTLNPIDIDMRALGVAVTLGIAAVLLAGLLPAWTGTRTDPADAVRGSRHGGTDTRAARLSTRGLLVGEVAVACSLLVGSAILARSFANLVNADRGLEMDGVVHVAVDRLEKAFFSSPEANALGTAAIRDQVASWPELAAFALSREVPPTWDTGTVYLGPPRSVPRGSRPGPAATESELMAYTKAVRSLGETSATYRVDGEFFDLYGIRILRGRALQRGDSDRDAVVSERLAALLWPAGDPIGQTFTYGRTPGYRVVGIAREIRLPTLDAELDPPEFYLSLGNTSGSLRLSLRCRAACPDVATMQSRLQQVHPALGARISMTAENTYLSQLRLPRAIAQLGGLFATVAVLTAAGGLFSVMTYTVGRRRREFGIRAALGAAPGQIRGLVFRDGALLVGLGVVAGVFGGWLVARALASFRYGVTVSDPITWAAVVGAIGVASLLALWRPSRHAMRVDPVKLLREE